ncbi:co-chaperone GroES [Patescibacteria group bacterium]|nr:co-chaperone GroES [Patescibacteria group bacterium]
MKLQPLNDRVFLEPVEDEMKTTKSGIIIPDTAEKERPVKAKVVAVGPGKLNDKGTRVKMAVKVGDLVLFKKYGPDELEVDGKKYLVGEESDIVAIIK